MSVSPSGLRRVLQAGAAAVLAGAVVAGLATPQAQAAPMPSSAKLPTSIATTPASNYTVPAGALFVSPSGSNTNAGSSSAPFKTLGGALAKVKAGQTVVMRGGVYREGASGYATGGTKYNLRLSGVTIQSYPGEQVWLDGTEVATGWSAGSGRWSLGWETPELCAGAYYTRNYATPASNGPCAYPDAIGNRSSLGNPHMLFRDGVELKEVSSLAQVGSDTFFYDWSARRVHIGFDPAGRTVEITRQAQALALFEPTNVAIKGIGVRRYASNQYANATQGALLLNGGRGVLLENVSVLNNAGVGLLSWGTRDLTLRRAVVSSNGSNGFNFAGSQPKLATNGSLRDDVTVEYSRFDRNNADSYGVDCQYSCAAAGVKMTGVIGGHVRWSTFNYNGGMRASGLWCDLACTDFKVYGSKMIGNARHGLAYEVSDRGTIASNIMANNGWGANVNGGGYGILVGSANTQVWNNTVANNKMGVFLYDDPRSLGVNYGPDSSRVGPASTNIDFVNNIVTSNAWDTTMLLFVAGGRSDIAGNTTGEQAIDLLASNSYAKPSSVRFAYWRTWADKPATLYWNTAELQAAKGSNRESGSNIIDNVVNPYLVNTDIGDYTLKAGSAPVKSGRPLPSDVATLIGLPTGVVVDRGVLTLGA
ncbi:DUF1565 domain-containing protein [Propioniciclava soli]|uniref:DUF1565 domain-containing protein n=1 Tax=Propioniciclava soli TaxID=2775081 RepID=UPI001E31B6B5|nr:right-handed parallel beta-helix repeat-containing protein [Propioniciclava soli]